MPKFKALPTQQELHRLFDYSPVTGELYWKTALSSRGTVGSVVGKRQTNQGYRRLRINSMQYMQHRIIWCWVTGEDPGALEIDHKNNQPDCNAWHNLRLCTHAQNMTNVPKIRGFYWDKTWSKWIARITYNSKYINLGRYDTEAEARAAYKKASLELHGEFSAVG